MRLPIAALASLALLAGVIVSGCGSGSSTSTSGSQAVSNTAETKTSAQAGAANPVAFTMTDYAFTPKNPTVKAGKATISAPNEGKLEHELIIFKTDKSPTDLPKKSGSVDEDALQKELVGEIPDVLPGETKKATFNLKPGKYLMVCNIPGHYAAGMYGTVTVK